jgi:chaperone modulatory protein CbpM
VIDESIELSISELSQRCSVNSQLIVELVQFGVVEPRGKQPEEWRFSGHDFVRLQKAIRLHRDLDINLAGVALVIELMEELQQLKSMRRLS